MSAKGRRFGWWLAVVATLAAFLAGAFLLLRPRPPQRIVLIVIDTLRRDRLSPYGSGLATPNIQALADRGQVLTGAYASFHQTSMSMGALFTGRTPSIESRDSRQTLFWSGFTWCGMARFAVPGEPPACIPTTVPTLAERLAAAGYWTIGVASNRFLYEPYGYSAGFDDWVEVGQRAGANLPRKRFTIAGKSDEWKLVRWHRVNRAAKAALARRPSDHFFLYVHYMDVHDYHFEDRSYDAAVEIVDRGVGELLAQLREEGLLENAVVILTSDHGEKLEEQRPTRSGPMHLGNPSFQEVLAIPLIIAPPVLPEPDRFLRSEDLYGLILEIAGQGPAATAVLDPDELFIGENAFRTYLKGRWKSTQRRSDGRVFLFDLEQDPGEVRDVADSHPDVVDTHRSRVEALSSKLKSFGEPRRELTPLEQERLRALGYLE